MSILLIKLVGRFLVAVSLGYRHVICIKIEIPVIGDKRFIFDKRQTVFLYLFCVIKLFDFLTHECDKNFFNDVTFSNSYFIDKNADDRKVEQWIRKLNFLSVF